MGGEEDDSTQRQGAGEGGRWGWVAGGQARIKKKEATLVGKMSGSFYVVLDMAAWCIEGRGRSAPHPPPKVSHQSRCCAVQELLWPLIKVSADISCTRENARTFSC